MEPAEGARSFQTSGNAYDLFMGRYSGPLAGAFADAAGVAVGQVALDVGCGPGALTGELVERLGPGAVFACDPSPPFVAECIARHRGVDVRQARAEELPYEDGRFDGVFAQLVLHFVTDATQAAREMGRVARPGGLVAACVWDFADEMEMLRHFWDAALAADPDAPDEARALRFGGAGEIAALFAEAGFTAVRETPLHVTTTYSGFDELWSGFLGGIGPAGAYCVGLASDQQELVRQGLFARVGSPNGGFSLGATARYVSGRTPT
ncbi:MAG: class I SAM-dependent methyltransferase [Acidimicrobiales bacterium]